MPGFQSPNYTQAPNELFDILMRDMSEAELRVVLVVVRGSLGYHRNGFKLSLSKMAEMTGMSESSVERGAKLAEEHGFIERVSDSRKSTYWRINTEWSTSKVGVELPLPQGQTTPTIGEQSCVKETIKETNKGANTPTAEEILGVEPRQEKPRVFRTEEQIKAGIRAAYDKAMERSDDHGAGDYPEDVRPVVSLVAELYSLTPPARKSSLYGRWIKEVRQLRDECELACPGLPVTVLLRWCHYDYLDQTKARGGKLPFIPTSPGGLLRVLIWKADQLNRFRDVWVNTPLENIRRVITAGTHVEVQLANQDLSEFEYKPNRRKGAMA